MTSEPNQMTNQLPVIEQYSVNRLGKPLFRVVLNGEMLAGALLENEVRPPAFYVSQVFCPELTPVSNIPIHISWLESAKQLWEKLEGEGLNPNDYSIGFTNCALTGHKFAKITLSDLPDRIQSDLMDRVGCDWRPLSDLAKEFWQIPQGDHVEILSKGYFYSYKAIAAKAKEFAKLAGVKITGIEPRTFTGGFDLLAGKYEIRVIPGKPFILNKSFKLTAARRNYA